MEYTKVKLGDILTSISETISKEQQTAIFLNTSDISEGKFLHKRSSVVKELPGQAKKKIKNGDILFSEIRPKNKRYAVVDVSNPNDYVVSTKLMVLRIKDPSKYYLQYIYQQLISQKMLHQINEIAESRSGTFPQITFDAIKNIELTPPPLEEQKRIADIFTVLDDKIELNNQMNQTLEEIASLLYKRWFVDFEFPDDKGNPYKSSGGEMVDSELGMIPKGWEVKELGSFFDVITGKKNANVSEKNGRYRFFTCSRNFTYSDQFEFDTGAIILAGNGDFNVKWYRGKFDAYQRTYVLSPHNQILLDVLFWIIRERLFEITVASKGSVIKFITKGMIENFKIIFPKKSYSKFVIIFSCLNKINEQNTQNNELVENLKLEILKELC